MSSGLTIGKGSFLGNGLIAAFLIGICIIGIIFWKNNGATIGSFPDLFAMKSIGVNGLTLNVRIAKTQEQQLRGLNNLTSMPRTEGILFVFDVDGQYGFSSKDMHFPVDVLWLDKDGTVLETQTDVMPGLEYPILNQSAARYVLVVNAGISAQYDIVPRTYVFLPNLN